MSIDYPILNYKSRHHTNQKNTRTSYAMSARWSKGFTDAHYDKGVWSVVDLHTGERKVDPFEGEISSLVSEENQRWCQSNPGSWLHAKFGDGEVHAVKRVSDGAFVKVWLGEAKGSAGHFRYQRF